MRVQRLCAKRAFSGHLRCQVILTVEAIDRSGLGSSPYRVQAVMHNISEDLWLNGFEMILHDGPGVSCGGSTVFSKMKPVIHLKDSSLRSPIVSVEIFPEQEVVKTP